ncbi:MAG TPA: Gfo/Idh/MocA family oxidoreductase [Clostridiaceae bacterium]|nr:Gfo/Idh/MocA family oxidoreductase [Clostridiaceae bacterium]
MIKVGLLGAGYMGGMHAACYEALNDLGVKVTAVADVYEDAAQELADKYQDIVVYGSSEDLIENADVNVIDICLPTHLHAKYAVAAMKKGYDVFCEKPVCLTESDMELMLKTKNETGAKLMVGQVIRLWTEYVWLKETVDQGTYGKVLSGVFQRVSARPTWAKEGWIHKPELSGGSAVDMHIHDTDFVRYILGDPDEVKSIAYRNEDGMIEQIFSIFSYGNNVAVALEGGWDFPQTFPFSATYRVKLEKATVTLDNAGKLTVYPNEGEPFEPNLEPEFESKEDLGGNVSSLGGYYNELKYFVEGLQGKNDLSVATLEEAIESVRLVKRELESAGGLVVK